MLKPSTGQSVVGVAGWLLVVLSTFVILWGVLAGPHFFAKQIKAGDLAEYDLLAPKKMMILDQDKNRQALEQAKRSVAPVMTKDATATADNLKRCRNLLDTVSRIQNEAIVPVTEDKVLDQELLALAADVPAKNWNSIKKEAESSLERFFKNVGLYPYTSKQQWQSQIFEFLSDKLDSGLRQRLSRILASQLRPDMQIDLTATGQETDKLAASLAPVLKEVEAGAIIVSKDKRITADEVKTLNAAGITEFRDPNFAYGMAIALFAAFVLFAVFLYTYEPKVLFSPSSLALMGTVIIITSAVALFVGGQYPQFVPLPAAALIFAVIFGRRVTAVLIVLMVIFLALGESLPPLHLTALAVAALIALGTNIAKRTDLMFTGFLIGLMQMFGYLIAMAFFGAEQPISLERELPLQMLGGLSSSIVAIGSLPFLEDIFGILTPYRIAELSEPNQPLMRQLEENAPGTYQHSLAVANLAEGGARAIGADVNLVRAGAMYHDIGKMVTPRYFIENQLGDKNPHDFIPPEESRARVLAHVTNGLALAQKHGLPKAVQAFIPEHQGTTIMAYFYHKACLRDGADNVDPKYYRYPGPKPQTRESAIVMLADVSEAVTHSMRDPGQEEVEAAIANVFKARWEDGQFSESGLTFEELEKVKRGFVRVWRTLHHERLKYPSTTTGRMPVPPNAVQEESLPPADDTELGPSTGSCC
ncbi:MAG: HDIG domain-containing protein [Candidatus Obscuribacterales bacterium]|nr:HDIG domain-containing protein [Candidatus Obscuribacterales bacterium]